MNMVPLVILILGTSSWLLRASPILEVDAIKSGPEILQDTTIVHQINANPNAGWEAGLNSRFSNYTVSQFKYLLGVKPKTASSRNDLLDVPIVSHPKNLELPKEFDARTAWPQCTTIGKILAEALSDRFCVNLGMNIALSANDLLACCGFMCGDGCDCGYPISAWRYFCNFVFFSACDPYFDAIGCSHPGCEPGFPTPSIWKQSKHFSVNAYQVGSDPTDIMAEVYKNGPVEVAFTVYEDFAHYKSGVYKHITGDVMGGHAVKLIGWGTTEDGVDYWLLANHWNRSWGDDGYFKIRRGTNECGIEEEVVAGMPSTKNILIQKYAATADDFSYVDAIKSGLGILQDTIVQQINSNPNAGWEAGLNSRFSNYTVSQFKYLLGVKPITAASRNDFLDIPIGHCGSCWAVAAAEALSDRFCVNLGMNITLSANDLLACCGFMCGNGCGGGVPIFAWRYFVHHGIVTEECDPYFDAIGCSHPGCEPGFPTPKCVKHCKDKNQIWKQSKHFGVNAYHVKSNPTVIMAEVYKNGPVEVAFTVYEDFAHYKSGVYKHITGDVMGGHAVKLIGWGTTEDGEDYWLLANQWNRSWGDDGYFKIRRGTNECGIERGVVAGMPSTKNILIQKYAADDDDSYVPNDASI
ncbi:hypothetical protein MKW92_028211 [Papaver armeniacum]|nr:hypothetical protein MKW92_028211 [Papaver armeniacum]